MNDPTSVERAIERLAAEITVISLPPEAEAHIRSVSTHEIPGHNYRVQCQVCGLVGFVDEAPPADFSCVCPDCFGKLRPKGGDPSHGWN